MVSFQQPAGLLLFKAQPWAAMERVLWLVLRGLEPPCLLLEDGSGTAGIRPPAELLPTAKATLEYDMTCQTAKGS